MTSEPGLAGWLQLTLTPGLGAATLRGLLQKFGLPENVLAAGRAAFRVADLLELSHLIGHIEEGHKEEAEC